MQLPAIQYGDWKTVKKRMERVTTQLERGADLVDVMTASGMLDTQTTTGLLSMFGIITGTRGELPLLHAVAHALGGCRRRDSAR